MPHTKVIFNNSNIRTYNSIRKFMQEQEAKFIHEDLIAGKLYQTWFFNGVKIDYSFTAFDKKCRDLTITFEGNSEEAIGEVEKRVFDATIRRINYYSR